MQKYQIAWYHLHPEPPPGNQAADEEVYLASEVDARIANIIATDSTRIAQLEYRIAELEKALRRISELDYAYAATNGAAYDAVQIAKSVL